MTLRKILLGFTLLTAVTAIAQEGQPPVPTPAEPFWWGVAASAYQSEDLGNSPAFQTDWDLFAAQRGRVRQPKGQGIYSYSQVDRDIAALKQLGVTHYRFGIEWARVEPEPGRYDDAAIAHYVEIARKLREAGIEPAVCLWHFTFPKWASDMAHTANHGWFNSATRERWPLYVERMARALAPHVRLFAPQNEPNTYAFLGYFTGQFSPGTRLRLDLYRRNIEVMAETFGQAADIIRRERPDAKIFTIQLLMGYRMQGPEPFGIIRSLGDEINYGHLDRVQGKADIIGFNYYFRVDGNVFTLLSQRRHFEADGLREFAEKLHERYPNKGILVTENGGRTVPPPATLTPEARAKALAEGELFRENYLRSHVAALMDARRKGVPVVGYFYWSLADVFEWFEGYESRFGLFELGAQPSDPLVPRTTANLYRDIIRGGVEAYDLPVQPEPLLVPLVLPNATN